MNNCQCSPHPSSITDVETKGTHEQTCHLFLSSSGLISLLLRPLPTLAQVLRLASRLPQLPVRTSLNRLRHLALLDLPDLRVGVDDGQAKLDAADQVLGTRYLLLGGIALLVLAELAREEDEAGLVGL